MSSLFTDQVDVWSDFVGGGSAASDYNNGANPAASATDLKVADYHFSIDATFSEACAIMKGAKDYSLTGEACTTEAKFVCVKSCKFFIFASSILSHRMKF